MAQKKTQEGSSASTNPKLDPNPPTNTEKAPEEWVSGDDPHDWCPGFVSQDTL
jgi:hypothetical protein